MSKTFHKSDLLKQKALGEYVCVWYVCNPSSIHLLLLNLTYTVYWRQHVHAVKVLAEELSSNVDGEVGH